MPKLSIDSTDLEERLVNLFTAANQMLNTEGLAAIKEFCAWHNALIQQETDKARLDELEGFEALDITGTLKRLKNTEDYINRRLAALKKPEGEAK